MKTKLLKKVRKRFGYYFRESDGVPILVDHARKKVLALDTVELPKTLKIPKEEYYWRILKDRMLTPFGYSYDLYMYNYCAKASNRKTKGSISHETD